MSTDLFDTTFPYDGAYLVSDKIYGQDLSSTAWKVVDSVDVHNFSSTDIHF
eukprot:TRINITY_DN6283_c0_g1_i1.p2 TRINITY_DN6283_c0_g1~~TRINITY_DN6283_c0_g1_i1.p2  ORF type:complete len:51 (-),score=7.03 TRINITY_DN6283_c0_g1_i1:174-326(-)